MLGLGREEQTAHKCLVPKGLSVKAEGLFAHDLTSVDLELRLSGRGEA